MKLLRTSLMALAMLIVAGTVASAAMSSDEVPDPEPTVSPSPTVEPTVSPSPEAEPLVEEGDQSVEGQTPDFSACEGLTGLENAICRHEALLDVKPDHQGLMNALDHLMANQERKAERWAEKHGEDGGTTAEGDSSSCPGKSCEPHGNGHSSE